MVWYVFVSICYVSMSFVTCAGIKRMKEEEGGKKNSIPTSIFGSDSFILHKMWLELG